MKFIIQTINSEIVHDFSRELIEAIKFNNWFYNNDDFQYILIETPQVQDEYCPCGSVEFMVECLRLKGINIKPINVPECLFKYAGREIKNGTFFDIKEFGFINNFDFIKSNDKIKGIAGFIDSIPIDNFRKNEFVQLSKRIEILSEYRCFVFRNELVGIKHYIGDFKIFPDIKIIEEMISVYKDAPIAYTLDVGIKDSRETIVVECHDFFSCGLYGFSEYKLLPLMFYRWWMEKIK